MFGIAFTSAQKWVNILIKYTPCTCWLPSVCLSHHFDNVPLIVLSWNFQEWLPLTKASNDHAKVQGQRSKIKVAEVKIQLSRFRTVIPVRNHIGEVPYCSSSSSIKFQGHAGQKINDFNPVSIRLLCRSQLPNPSDLPCLFWKVARNLEILLDSPHCVDFCSKVNIHTYIHTSSSAQ